MRRRFRIAVSTLLLSSLVSCGTMSSSDATIQDMVTVNLHHDHLEDVRVTVLARRVILEGTVGSKEELEEAQSDAERVAGVVAVRNNLRIAPKT